MEVKTQIKTQTTIFKCVGPPPEVEHDIQTIEKVLEKLKSPVSNNILPSVFDPFIIPTKEAADKTFVYFEIVTKNYNRSLTKPPFSIPTIAPPPQFDKTPSYRQANKRNVTTV